ncbi:UDP-glycosyltransferase [Ladona fulva]|uniref:UDP-glucuronosyltransferase n=1 Tax=Ladona fulva TaxID=123851 RepID=A0A8K0K5W2_LADFU|nr:UDP-glycosyltransferase [Ladona fulva]
MGSTGYPQGILCFSVVFMLCLSTSQVSAAKILFVFSLSGKSHNFFFQTLSTELASKGHDVTYITPYPMKNTPKNYRQIPLGDVSEVFGKGPKTDREVSLFEIMPFLRQTSIEICRRTYALPEVKELIKNEHFDMVVTSTFYSDCYLAFSHVFNSSLVLMSPAGTYPNDDVMMGNPALPSFVPIFFSLYTDHMNTWERFINTLMSFSLQLFHRFFIIPPHDEVIMEALGGSVPPITELQKKISLLLVNSHFTFQHPHPLVPTIQEIGGIHVKPPKPLPEDIKKFMDDAKDGVIYFSMGSFLQSADLPESSRKALLEAFGELKQKVLWKWENDSLPGQPPNVKLSKWWPQSDILAHPNIKLFITHGGLLSYQEAVLRGVPLIGIPVFGDQKLNVNRAVNQGVGLQMSLSSLTKETILKTIRTVLDDPSFAEKMKKRSSVAKDTPQPPLEKAVYWIEYVLRHEGAHHMRSAGVDLSWFQFFLVDIAAILGLGFITVVLVVLFILKMVLKLCGTSNNAKVKKQ